MKKKTELLIVGGQTFQSFWLMTTDWLSSTPLTLKMFLFEMVATGNNFRQITQILANSRNTFHLLTREKSWSSPWTKFPSTDKLVTVFLEFYYQKKSIYEESMKSRSPTLFISADHTFKVSKKAGRFRSLDEKFVKSDLKLFIVMDATSSVFGWTLTE